MKLTGAQGIVRVIAEQGIDTVFGLPGGMVLPLFDALYAAGSGLRHVLTAHEQGAAHAADGWARASGRPGVCVATSGPGATNLVTGIATAFMDSSPVVFLTGNIDAPMIGTDCFQEVDITGVTMPVTKHNVLVREPARLAETLREAFFIAQSGRPGPVLVDIPRDVQMAEIELQPDGPVRPALGAPSARRLAEAAAAVDRARAPLILCGGGVLRAAAWDELKAFAETIDAPVCATLMGLGGFPASDGRFLGMAGMHGSRRANEAVAACDLLIGVGTRFSERLVGRLSADVLHIDADRAEINKNVRASSFVVGDAKAVLAALSAAVTPRRRPAWRRRAEAPADEQPAPPLGLPERLCGAVRGALGDDAIVVTDVGQHQMWAAGHIPCQRPRTWITSGGTGTMGFGLGAAIGAQLAFPERDVVLVTGDGSLGMSCAELATVARQKLPLMIVVLNNRGHGMVRQWQTVYYGGRYAGSALDGPDFVRLGRAFGLESAAVDTPERLAGALREAAAARRATLLDCRIDAEAMVRPMRAPGGQEYIL